MLERLLVRDSRQRRAHRMTRRTAWLPSVALQKRAHALEAVMVDTEIEVDLNYQHMQCMRRSSAHATNGRSTQIHEMCALVALLVFRANGSVERLPRLFCRRVRLISIDKLKLKRLPYSTNWCNHMLTHA